MNNLKELLINTVEEINHLEKAKGLLEDVYFEANRNMGLVSVDTIRKVHKYLGFDRGEDE